MNDGRQAGLILCSSGAALLVHGVADPCPCRWRGMRCGCYGLNPSKVPYFKELEEFFNFKELEIKNFK